MKMIQNGRLWGMWKVPVAVGFGLSAIGLSVGARLIWQLLPCLLKGAQLPVTSGLLLIESMVSMLLVLMGFSLMVIGSDPFEDTSGDFETPTQLDSITHDQFAN